MGNFELSVKTGFNYTDKRYVVDPDHEKKENYLDSVFTPKIAFAFFTEQFGLSNAASRGIAKSIMKYKNYGFDTSKKLRFNIEILANLVKNDKIQLISGIGYSRQTTHLFIKGLKEFDFIEE
jgi:hypothetical protein